MVIVLLKIAAKVQQFEVSKKKILSEKEECFN